MELGSSRSRPKFNILLSPEIKKTQRTSSLTAPKLKKHFRNGHTDSSEFLLDSSLRKIRSRRHDPSLLSKYFPNEEVKSIQPSPPSKILKENPSKFTDFEKKEILQYPEVYYIGNSKKKHNGKYNDERGYYRTFVGDHIGYRYEIMHIVGDGSFGIVISSYDHKLQQPVAIKILRTGKEFDEIGELEVQNLNGIRRNGYDDDVIIEKYEEFMFREHYCIVFELLNLDLYQFLKKNEYRGMNSNVVRRIAVQLIIGLKQIHNSGYIHCDLKPENILFRAENKSSVKIIDFGSACRDNKKIFTYIQSRYYRAPEVILELDYSAKIDIWSLGCILFELNTGYRCFTEMMKSHNFARLSRFLGISH